MTERRWQPSPLLRASVVLHLLVVSVVIVVPAVWPWALAAVVADHVLLTALGLWPRSRWLGGNWTRLPDRAGISDSIALTFDDGPDPQVTRQVLDILDAYGAKATFFCIGEQAARHPDLCRELVRRGHAVENHSLRHRHSFSLLGYRGLARELGEAQETLTRITGQRPLFFRAPAGLRNPLLDPVLARLGLRLASWSARGFDTRSHDAAQVSERLLRRLRAGSILLMHDGNAARTADGTPMVVAVLPTVLAGVRAAGLRCTTLREALT